MTTPASPRRTLTVGLPLALLMAAAGTAAPQTVKVPFVDLSIPDAFVRAEREQKLVLAYFYDTESESRRMLAQTFGDEGVRRWMEEHVVAVQIPYDQRVQVGRFSVTTFPSILLLRPDQVMLYRIEGWRDAPAFLMGFSSALVGSGKVERPDGENSENPMAWLAWANWLFANAPDRPDEVLEAYLWCLDRGEQYIPGFRESKFDYLCEHIAYLKGHIQAAVQALWDRRNRLRGEIVAGIGSERDVWELWRFNFWVRDELNTLEVFDELKGRGERQTRAMEILLDLDLHRFVAWERYKDVITIVPDPYSVIDTRLKAFEASLDPDAPPATETRAEIVDDGIEYFEALLASGLGGDAMKLFERVTDAVPTGRAYRAFMTRTNRLEFYVLTQKIGDKGLPLVNDKGIRMINIQLDLISAGEDQDEDQTEDDGGER